MAKSKNKNKGFRLGDMPQEVYWAKFVGVTFIGGEYVQQVGMDQYNKIKEIQNKYPEWFPWETKYDSIPEDIHEAYRREAFPWLYEPISIATLPEDEYVPKSIMEWSESAPVTDTPEFTYETFIKAVKETYEHLKEEDRKYREAKIKAKKLWDKYYKKHGLQYRG